ncbi:hypothetical protein D3C71_18580 [compost metagenome]
MTATAKKCAARRGLESLGLEEIASRKEGESDLDYIKAVLDARGLGFVERKGTCGELFIILWNGEPTIEMIACRLPTVHDISADALPGYGLTVFEFLEGTLESY